MSKTGTSLSYKYNDGGIRTQKTVDGAVTDYYLSGDKVLYEIRKNSGGTVTDTLYYTYDEKGALVSFNLKNSVYPNGADFYYVRNGQNDIIGILDNAGTQVVTYTYDTWGKLISTNGTLASSVGTKNSYLYRGYRYDTETKLYYLNSRYYNPEIGRFINADGLVSTGQGLNSSNMFTYCGNNPVMRADPSGHFWFLAIIAAVVVAVVAVTAIVTVVQSKPASKVEYTSVADVTEAWKNENKADSKEKEHGAIIYEKTDKKTKKKTYTTGRTYTGGKDNIIRGFVTGYVSGGISSLFSSQKNMVGFIHSHPEDEPGYHSDFPSNPDLFLLNLPGINEVYVVPWDHCSGIPDIINASDKKSWQH